MLTYNQTFNIKRKDRPWLLFIMALIWILGTVFFHSPWEPYEPFVFAVVKGIIYNDSWLVPYVSNAPYLEIQPFYFWIYAVIIKLFNITNITHIANTIRIINTVIIFGVLIVMGRVGSGLSSFKSGRTVILILISEFGFINICYKLSPSLLILFGFSLFLYALQKYKDLPGISGWLLFLGLLFMSINFTCEFTIISIVTLILLPIMDGYWRNKKYYTTVLVGVGLFATIFYMYGLQLKDFNSEFFLQWQNRYTRLLYRNNYNFWIQSFETIKLLNWYIAPAWMLMIWSIIRRKNQIFADKTLQVSLILFLFLFLFTCISGDNPEQTIFPVVILVAILGAVEVDSIKITAVSLFNPFSIIIFGFIGFILWGLYLMLGIHNFHNDITKLLMKMSQNYTYKFDFWQILLALTISIIWLIMITRRHIRGREMVTNWAAGSTFVLVLFLSLWLPWFDSILTFKPIVNGSLKYLKKDMCVATNTANSTQIALWYYYVDISLMPAFINLDYSICNQAVVATENINDINTKQWNIIWQNKRPIDNKIYYVLRHK